MVDEENDKPAIEEKDSKWKIELAQFADLCRNCGLDGIYLRLRNVTTLKEAIALTLRLCDFFDGFGEAVNWSRNSELLVKVQDVHSKTYKLLQILNVTKQQQLTLFR